MEDPHRFVPIECKSFFQPDCFFTMRGCESELNSCEEIGFVIEK